MSPELQSLIDLQRIDAALIDARGRITAHPQKVAEADARLAEAKAVLDQAKDKLRISQEERRADDAERELMEWKKVKFMERRIGEDRLDEGAGGIARARKCFFYGLRFRDQFRIQRRGHDVSAFFRGLEP